MSTSGSIDFIVNGTNIVTDALYENGIYGPSDTIPDADITLCMRRLNIMVKAWNNKPHMHLKEDVTITLTPGTESYTWGSGGDIDEDRPTRVVTARRVNSSGNEVPIEVGSRQEYKDLPTKDSQGATNLVYYDPQLELGVLYVWPTGDTGTPTIICETQRQVEDFDAVTDNPDFPKEAYEALYLGLAVNIRRVYSLPPDGDLQQRFAQSYDRWLEHDEELTGFYIIPQGAEQRNG